MRFLVVGAGSIGGSILSGLIDAGHEVYVVARGVHGGAMGARGLTVARPGGLRTYVVDVHATVPRGLSVDGVLVCVKSQDTASVVEDLLQAGYGATPVVCAQNGVTNERAFAEAFTDVYGMMVWMPATHLEPGKVEVFAEEPMGHLVVGKFPTGVDRFSAELAKACLDGGLTAEPVEDIDAWKHGKLLLNLGNAIDAFCLPLDADHPIRTALLEETRAVFRAAGREFVDREELLAATEHVKLQEVAGHRREGGSTWQSATRRLPNEVEHLNGSICVLGAKVGAPTPTNQVLVDIARERPEPRSVDLEARLRDRPVF